MSNLESLEKKINSEFGTKIKDSKIKHNQIYVEIDSEDTVATLSKKIHKLEHEYFPQIVEKYILNKL